MTNKRSLELLGELEQKREEFSDLGGSGLLSPFHAMVLLKEIGRLKSSLTGEKPEAPASTSFVEEYGKKTLFIELNNEYDERSIRHNCVKSLKIEGKKILEHQRIGYHPEILWN
jgi:hypothetical protein